MVQTNLPQQTSRTLPHTPVTVSEIKFTDVHRVHLKDLFLKQVGRFVGVEFTKKDGTVRQLNGRLGVVKHLKGGTNTVESTTTPYLVVYDVKTPGYRAVNLATVSAVRALNTRYTVLG